MMLEVVLAAITKLKVPIVTRVGRINGSQILPPAGARYVDRSRSATGMIHAGDAVVRAFASIGWHWGGYWHSLKDYQHFSATGR